MERLLELSLWMESRRGSWKARGVDVLDHGGQTIFSSTVTREGKLFIGTIESCGRPLLVEAEFIPLIVLGDMSVEHSKILIENAVEQVAGRV